MALKPGDKVRIIKCNQDRYNKSIGQIIKFYDNPDEMYLVRIEDVGKEEYYSERELLLLDETDKCTPVMEFSSEEQAQKLLEEWQDRLFLNDWTIVLLVNVSPGEIGEHLLGKNDLDYEGKNCVIYIVKPHDDLKNQIVKYCAEGILIHELLHCKYNLMRNNETYESAFLGVHQHMMLEQMAKSLLMAKYNLKFDWFKQYRGN